MASMEEIKPVPQANPPQPLQNNSQVNPAVQNQKPIVKKIPSQDSGSKIKKLLPIIIVVIVVSLGIVSGLLLSSKSKSSQSSTQGALSEENLSGEQKQSFNQTFRDQAEGVIERNDDLDKYAQGTHKLIRPGGEDQTAFLTSSVLDLDEYNGKKVKVFGETFGSSQVGWLMDVGKVEEIK